MSIDYKMLTDAAESARLASYSPYSHISVGAALLADSGKIYLGTNIENAAYSPTVCAERVAFFKAISEGERVFRAIAIVGGKDDVKKEFAPCGVCRQVMSEFCDGDFEIVLTSDGEVKTYTLRELLPHSFGKKNFV